MKKRKNKPSKLGINWENVFKYIFVPIIVIISVVSLFIVCEIEVKKYIDNIREKKLIMESEEKVLESIKESESYERYLRESSLELEKKKREKAIIEEANQIKLQTEFENKIFSQYWPKGTYVRNDITKECGIVDYCLIPNVYTREGWYFESYPENGKEGFFNKDITKISWLEWNNWANKKLKNNYKSNQNKMNMLIKEEKQKREKSAKEKYPPNPKYGHVKYNKEYYYIINWDDGILTLRNKNDSSKIVKVQYDDNKVTKLEQGELIKFLIKE